MSNERFINTLVIALVLLFLMFTVGCGKKEDTIIVTQNCTVSKVGTDALIECPDGSSVTLPATTVTETIYETPIVIEVPKRNCQNENRHDHH